MNPYHTLGVKPDASASDVKAAHRRAVKAHHPDAGGDPEAFAAAQLAYEILTDTERRKRFDETGQIDAPVSDAEDGMVISAVSQLIEQVIAATVVDLDRNDVRAALLTVVAEKGAEIRKTLAEQEMALARIRVLQRRFKSAKRRDLEPMNPLALALEHHAQKVGKALEESRRFARVQVRVTEVFEAMRYDFDAAPVTMMRFMRAGFPGATAAA